MAAIGRGARTGATAWWRLAARPQVRIGQCWRSTRASSSSSGGGPSEASPAPSQPLPPLFDLSSAPGPRPGDAAVLAMSGGVDSSVAALLALQQGLVPRPLFMRNWNELDESGTFEPGAGGATGCTWMKDWEGVQQTCAALGLGRDSAELLDLSKDYWLSVFQPALEAWERGETPNPDVGCNREIKFGALMDRVLPAPAATAPDAFGRRPAKTWLVTGHYARVSWRQADGAWQAQLSRARDRNKDQSYFLSSVSPERLAQAHFPLSDLLKTEVRDIARRYLLPAAEKEESMGLCFVGERPRPADAAAAVRQPLPRNVPPAVSGGAFGAFLASYLTPVPGPILDPAGKQVGTHAGLHSLTVGQRARVPGAPSAWFVARKDAASNAVHVVAGGDHAALYARSLRIERMTWLGPPRTGTLLAQVRHRGDEVACEVLPAGDGVHVCFPTPVLAVAPGQVCALYDGDVCVGSGVIATVQTLQQ